LTGVFDLEELVDLLRAENAEDTAVIAVPKEMNYADHLVIVTARLA
jgi:ribosomal silencing factor RsfS